MNIHDIMGKSTPDFLRDRGFALFYAIFAAVVMTGLIFPVGRISCSRFLVNYSLRERLLVCIAVIALVCGGGLPLHVGPAILLALPLIQTAGRRLGRDRGVPYVSSSVA